MFCVQCRDLEEGNGARWFELANSRCATRDAARALVVRLRATDDEESLCLYRVTEVGSDAYYSQPTDRLEY